MSEKDLLDFRQARFVFDHMTEEIHFWEILRDAKGQIKTWRLIYANKAALKTWGHSSLEEIVNLTTDEIFGDGATKHYLHVVEKIMNEGRPHSFQDYFPNVDRHFHFTSVPLGQFFITTGWDISEFVLEKESLSKDRLNLQKQISSSIALELKVKERTLELEQANSELTKNIEMLKYELETKDAIRANRVVKISELLLKQSDLLQANARIVEELNCARKENEILRMKLLPQRK
jgi:hypothetical protein